LRKRLGLRSATIRTVTGRTIGRPITPHGLRATFCTWGEGVGFSRELLEEALGHQVGTAVERAYRRTDSFARRRTVMQAWADFCHGKQFRAPMA
jgi:integrase